MLTIKKLLSEISKEKYDTKNTAVYANIDNRRHEIKYLEQYDNEVHFVIGDSIDDEVKIKENGE